MNPINQVPKIMNTDHTDGPSDEELLKEFLAWPNVFETTSPYLLDDLLDLTDQISFSSIEEYHKEGSAFCINQGNTSDKILHVVPSGWTIKSLSDKELESGKLATLASKFKAKEVFQLPIIPGFHWENWHSPANTILHSKPPGTYLFSCEEQYGDRFFKVKLKTKSKVMHFEIPRKQNTSQLLIENEIKEALSIELDKYLDEFANLKELLAPCNSFLDLSFCGYLKATSRKKVLANLDVNQLENIEDIFTDGNKSKNRWSIRAYKETMECYLDIILFLAKNEKTNIKIHRQRIFLCYDEVDSIKQHHERLHSELKGEKLEWALNRYFEILLDHTDKAEPIHLQIPPINKIQQTFFDNEDFGQDLKVQMRDSEDAIHVHKIMLAAFSEELKCMLFGKFKENNSDTISFPDYSDEVVRQLLRCIYGFKPNFEKCSVVELLKVANTLLSPLFTNLVNVHLEELLEEEKVEALDLTQIVAFRFWIPLPTKNTFFKYLSVRWDKVIDTLPKKEQKSFREEFFNDWLNYITPKYEGLIKV